MKQKQLRHKNLHKKLVRTNLVKVIKTYQFFKKSRNKKTNKIQKQNYVLKQMNNKKEKT